jgi:nucleoside-diphosphate-sugar epimerase
MKAFVTGGAGFLGNAIVGKLLARGDSVTAVSRSTYPALTKAGAVSLAVDLGNKEELKRAMDGHEVVFHVAAKTGMWGRREDFLHTNVEGTRNVVEACRSVGVKKLVMTSSPSVIFDGHSHLNALNNLPYPATYESDYPETKAMAERLALDANSPTLPVVALRPHLIYGPGDPHLLPRLLARARAGRLRMVGDGQNMVSITHVANAAVGHLQAAEKLVAGAACAGKAYFLADAEPVKLWDWLNNLFTRLGIPAVRRQVPVGVARFAGSLAEMAWRGMSLDGEPPMTRFVASQLATSHTYDLTPSRNDVGYAPPLSGADAFEETVAYWKAQSQVEAHV